MARIALSKEFRNEFHKLNADLQKKTMAMLDKLVEDPSGSGLNLESYNAAADPRARTARVDKFWRAILATPEPGTYILFGVKSHDDADRWMQKNRFSVNALTNSLEVVSEEDIKDAFARTEAQGYSGVPTTDGQQPASADEGPLARRSDKEFRQLGIVDPDLIAAFKQLQTEDQVQAVAQVLPLDQQEAVIGLACGESVDEIYKQLLALEEPPTEPIEELSPVPEDEQALAQAVAAPSASSEFQILEGSEELSAALAGSFEAWRVFLHPMQRAVVERHYNGPAMITGGAGTGKTVALLHRVKHLTDSSDPLNDSNGRILVTTFTNRLVDDLRLRLAEICDQSTLDRIKVSTVDSIARGIVAAEDGPPSIASPEDLDEAVRIGFDDEGLAEIGLSPTFLQQEWEEIVVGKRVRSLDQYLKVSRAGRGVRLDRKKRARVWRAIDALENYLTVIGKRTFLQIADRAAEIVDRSTVKPYVHVLVDESQDLHPAQWRLLRALVAEGPNDLFIAGDTHQRIYDHRVTLSSLGIKVRGRSSRLRLNYRTTRPILEWSLRLITGEEFDDLDGEAETLLGYRSATDGADPVVEEYRDAESEYRALAERVRAWHEKDGIDWREIGICARRRATFQAASDFLSAASIPLSGPNAVHIGTMHQMKGLEFRCVAMIGVNDANVPPRSSLTPESDDPIRHGQDLQRERCLLYVAATRAREQLSVTWSGEPSRLLSD